MNRLSNKGQSLAIFVIFLPFFIMLGAFIIDLGYARYNQNRLNNTTKLVLEYGLKHIDEEPYDQMVSLIYKNDPDIDDYKIIINQYDSTVRVYLQKATKGFFGNIIKKDIYKERSSFKGTIENEKILIERDDVK